MSIYESFNPESMSQEEKEKYIVEASGEYGFDTSRIKHKVSCRSCGKILHSSTTWAPAYIERHEEEGCINGRTKKRTMKISKNEICELQYLKSGGTVVDWPERQSLQEKGLITVQSCFSNASHNAIHCELTDKGRESLFTDIAQEAAMWL